MNKSSFFFPSSSDNFYDLTMYKEVSLHNNIINKNWIKLKKKKKYTDFMAFLQNGYFNFSTSIWKIYTF